MYITANCDNMRRFDATYKLLDVILKSEGLSRIVAGCRAFAMGTTSMMPTIDYEQQTLK